MLIKNGVDLVSNKQGSRYSVNTDYFKNIDSAEKAFWLGFICADGGIKRRAGRDSYHLRVNQSNSVLLEKFREDIGYSGEVKFVTKKQKGRYSDKPFYEINIHSAEFTQNLLNCGKTRYKKDQTNIPESVPKEYIVDFIRGYFEGDGTLFYANANKSWCFGFSGEEGLLLEIREIIDMGNMYKDKSIWSLDAKGNLLVKKFVDKLYYKKGLHGIKHLAYRSEENDKTE